MAHRKVDVDEIVGDEDAFLEPDVEGGASLHSLEVMETVGRERVEAARQLLSRGDYGALLATLLQIDPIIQSQDEKLEATKVQILSTLFQAISSIRSQDIQTIIQGLAQPQIDLLIRYLYKAMAAPAIYNPAVTLLWHEKVVEVGGVGSIARCLTNRRSI